MSPSRTGDISPITFKARAIEGEPVSVVVVTSASANWPDIALSTSFRKSDETCETMSSTGASPLWRSKTLRFVASFRCNPLEGLPRPSKPPAPYSISEVDTDF